jgi:capsule polysaccharide export protein KpsE/RkpR
METDKKNSRDKISLIIAYTVILAITFFVLIVAAGFFDQKY